jgi:DNA (cytosine-5)-methyltransferase 1
MNKVREQDLTKPCNTVGSSLAKVSLNSSDLVLCMNGRYRRFMPREVTRIQSFLDEYKLIGSDAAQYKAFGNDMPPVLMWYIARNIITSIDKAILETKPLSLNEAAIE